MKSGWQRFLVGLMLLLVAVAFAFWGFSKNTLSYDQRQILLWILPLASGFGAGAFAGSLSVKAKGMAPSLVISATSGFAVWVLSFFFLFPKSQQASSNSSATPLLSAMTIASNSPNVRIGSGATVIISYGAVYINVSNQLTGIQSVPSNSDNYTDFESFTNELFQTLNYHEALAFNDMFRHATNAIKLFESAEAKGAWWSIHLDEKTASVAYLEAALAVDNTEKDPDLAYSLAQKSFTLYRSPLNDAVFAMVSHNFARSLVNGRKYEDAMKIQRNAIAIYENEPQGFIDALIGTNAVWKWYQNAAWLAFNTGNFSEANRYSSISVAKHPSKETVGYRLSVLRELGSNDEVFSLTTRWFKPVLNGRIISFEFNTNATTQ